MAIADYSLSDRFAATDGTVFLSGIQALARIGIEQLHADRRAGLNTAALVTGYPGSPLGGFDSAVRAAAAERSDLDIVCRPALNEEYAASAVMGSQLAANQPDRRYDGVVGIWYGKAPGVDRASDALRHAVYAGTSRHGGAIALVGDDPMAKSSTLPSSSAGMLADLHMPMLYPGDPAEALDLGRHGIAMSRFCGLWASLKVVADVADGTASVVLDIDRVQPVIPDVGLTYDRAPEGRLLTPLTLDLEREIYEVRYELAKEYASANDLNRLTTNPSDAWLGIIATGITYGEIIAAFEQLGLVGESAIERAGIRLLQMQLPIPFNRSTIQNFAKGLDEVFVIEEKQPNLELLIKDTLYSNAVRPEVFGKNGPDGSQLIPGHGGLSADGLVAPLRSRLTERIGHLLAPERPPTRPRIPLTIIGPAPDPDEPETQRAPFYCSGCPHNRSTEVPEGSLVGAGIGCHTMTLLMDPERVGEIAGLTPMGNEGTQWIGMSDFVERDHFIQNLGDGTYFHSGQLAVTAAIASGVNMTYKLLYNSAVAMTGGQTPEGQLSVPEVASVLRTQGVKRIIITTPDVATYTRFDRSSGIEVWDRDRLIEAQELLATIEGVTVLIHDQQCAAELRRDRKRGRAPTPSQRIVIDERVCEGCGDCGRVSNCLSVQPVETPFGRKTRIDQTSCNLDYSCVNGDCPSFLTVETDPTKRQRAVARAAHRLTRRILGSGEAPAVSRKVGAEALAELLARTLPTPELAVSADDVAVRICGIGGTGVVTVAQILGTAAMLDGFEVRGLDQIGLSQKAGPVVSDLMFWRPSPDAGPNAGPRSSHVASAEADLILAFDQLVAASDRGLVPASSERTVVVGSNSTTPTGAMISDPTIPAPSRDVLAERLAGVTREGHRHWVDAVAVANAAFGNASSANMIVTGMAAGAGALPIDPARIHDAIELNGVAAERNIAAFDLGRWIIADPEAALSLLDVGRSTETSNHVSVLARELAAFGDDEAANDFDVYVASIAQQEEAAVGEVGPFTAAVAEHLFKLTAYKDEYEVARLLVSPDGQDQAGAMRSDGATVSYNLHPPAMKSFGLDRKITLGPWFEPVLATLARGKRLRGTALDPFGYAKVRRLERKLPERYQEAMDAVAAKLTADNLALAVEIASLPDGVRGYEELKLSRIEAYEGGLARAVSAF